MTLLTIEALKKEFPELAYTPQSTVEPNWACFWFPLSSGPCAGNYAVDLDGDHAVDYYIDAQSDQWKAITADAPYRMPSHALALAVADGLFTLWF
ncbi:MAG: hypothetical protein A3I05_01655 [Deltaproteobacteria bacterium RIFCSPLOWO2_02_FULL_44_10]|nr:MAG: hypothetical protein A3C46_05250 [Deltaproteobacteria bacterium RIFCSPHIGHO2_02_FULL_44_16]OGQ45355.1 MAG: hypothetical protein A3I05_01655 [Deltaproteobacteria bacterium RIFCSPLOWO2_02_FULL_44_10]